MLSILVVDDEADIRSLISHYLKLENFEVIEAENGEDALDQLAENQCDLAIVDIMMPLVDGYELTEDIRNFYDIPIILLTAKGEIEDKEKGFLLGADDYIVKPFDPRELIFRVKALLRRYDKSTQSIITLGSTIINYENYEVEVDGKVFFLPSKEFELLFLLSSYPEQAFSRGQIIERIWGVDYEGDERTVDVHIKRLRERFAHVTQDFTIKTIRNVGYKLTKQKETG